VNKILVLGGTAEARALADRIGPSTGHGAVYSLAGRTAQPRLPACDVRTGPFGGVDGLLAYLRDTRIAAVIDATHPFADQMPSHAAQACAAAHLPRLKLVRPAWQPRPGDRWLSVPDARAAAAALNGAERVFLAIGIQELDAFATLDETLFLVRTVEDQADVLPLRAYRHIAGRGPFTVADERELLARHLIDTIVCKNSGGDSSSAKLDAARALGLRVVMIERPPAPPGDTVATVADALAWLARLGHRG
jgi:precorrin-6A/cobalt-precorrin-6A reductase